MVSDVTFANWPLWRKCIHVGLVAISENAPWLLYILIPVGCVIPFAVVGAAVWYLRPDVVTLILAELVLILAVTAYLYRRWYLAAYGAYEDYRHRWRHMVEKYHRLSDPFRQAKILKKRGDFRPIDEEDDKPVD